MSDPPKLPDTQKEVIDLSFADEQIKKKHPSVPFRFVTPNRDSLAGVRHTLREAVRAPSFSFMYPEGCGVECCDLTESSQTVTPLKLSNNASASSNLIKDDVDSTNRSTPAVSRTHFNEHYPEINTDNDNQSIASKCSTILDTDFQNEVVFDESVDKWFLDQSYYQSKPLLNEIHKKIFHPSSIEFYQFIHRNNLRFTDHSVIIHGSN